VEVNQLRKKKQFFLGKIKQKAKEMLLKRRVGEGVQPLTPPLDLLLIHC